MKRNFIFSLATLALTTLFTVSASAQNLGVYPTTLDFKLAAGQSEAKAINLSNSADKKVQFRVYLNDWIRDSLGGHIYYEPNTQPNSCASWLSLDKNFIELEPGESTQLTVRMLVPQTPEATEKMRWSMLFIETVEEQVSRNDKSAQATVRNLLRVGVHVYETPPNLTEKAIKVMDLKPNPEIENAWDLVCMNTGEIMIECKAHVELTSATGDETKLDFIEFPMFPGQKRYVTFELPKNMPAGKYSALGVLDGGEDIQLEAIQTDIEVKNAVDAGTAAEATKE